MSSRSPALRRRLTVLALAVSLDVLAGEPPAPVHPVVWIGRLIGWLEQRAIPVGPCRDRRELATGAAITGLILLVALLPAAGLQRLAGRFSRPLETAILALALKPAFAIRALFAAIRDLEQPLARGDLATARQAVARIVSRDVATLEPPLLIAAAIESLAENLSDSVVAPLLAYLLGGLPLAYAYRAANTLDAMLGYRGRKEYLGKVPAHLDDLLNLAPARLTALLLMAASPSMGAAPLAVARRAWREQRRTASPNSGWPMAATAVALGCCLEKRGAYRLNPGGRAPILADLGRARRLTIAALGAGALLLGWRTRAWAA